MSHGGLGSHSVMLAEPLRKREPALQGGYRFDWRQVQVFLLNKRGNNGTTTYPNNIGLEVRGGFTGVTEVKFGLCSLKSGWVVLQGKSLQVCFALHAVSVDASLV